MLCGEETLVIRLHNVTPPCEHFIRGPGICRGVHQLRCVFKSDCLCTAGGVVTPATLRGSRNACHGSLRCRGGDKRLCMCIHLRRGVCYMGTCTTLSVVAVGDAVRAAVVGSSSSARVRNEGHCFESNRFACGRCRAGGCPAVALAAAGSFVSRNKRSCHVVERCLSRRRLRSRDSGDRLSGDEGLCLEIQRATGRCGGHRRFFIIFGCCCCCFCGSYCGAACRGRSSLLRFRLHFFPWRLLLSLWREQAAMRCRSSLVC